MTARAGYTVADCMCGAGGSTSGMWRFFDRAQIPIGRFVAINHDKDAIATHARNHPRVVHYCQDFETVNLRDAFPQGRCDFAWASTACTQHSRARGGRPIEDQLREGPWHLVHFVSEIYVARMAIENVPEFTDWAPLGANARPLRSRRGEVFAAWKRTMETWYDFEWRVTNAADFGGGTTRERFIALLKHRRLRGPILWAVPTHSRDGSGDLFSGHRERWRGANEFLDFALPSKPIVGRRVPLAAPTLLRALHGIWTFWGASAARAFQPDIRDAAYEGLAYVRRRLATAQDGPLRRKPRPGRKPARKPKSLAQLRAERERRIARLRTAIVRYEALIARVEEALAQPVARDGAAVRPFVVNLRGTDAGAIERSVHEADEPVPSPTASRGQHVAVAIADLAAIVGTNRTNNVAHAADEPIGGVTASAYAGGHFVVLPAAAVVETLIGGNRANNVPRPDSAPMPSPTTGGGLFALDGELTTLHLGQHGGGVARPESAPFASPATSCAASAAIPIVTRYNGEVAALVTSYERETDGVPSRARPASEPVGGILTRERFGLLEPVVVPPSSAMPARPADAPISSPTTTQRGAQLVEGVIVPASSEGAAKPLDGQLDSPTTRGGPKLVEPIVEPYLVTTNRTGNGEARARALDATIGARTTRNGEAVIQAFLVAHFGERPGQTPRVHDSADPVPSVTPRGGADLVQAALERVEAIDPGLRERLLIGQDGQIYVAHLHFRMLHPQKELAPAMGFARDYQWPDSNTLTTKFVGNAVQVDWADAHVAAFLADWVPARADEAERVA